MKMLLTTLTLSVVLASAAGAMTVSPPDSTTEAMTASIPPDERGETTLTVDNPRNVPVTIYAEEGDFDHPLGQIPAHAEGTLVMPVWMVGPGTSVRLFVHPKNGFDLASELLDVTPGEHLGIRVPR